MKHEFLGRGALSIAWCFAIAVLTVTALPHGTAFAQSGEIKQSGTVTISQTQIAFIASGNIGGGKLEFQGKTYDFTIGGLGVGGIGVSQIEAVGEVYNLTNLSDFEGAYGQARTGIAVGSTGGGDFWLENPDGVYIRLETKRKGLALSLGADAAYIGFD